MGLLIREFDTNMYEASNDDLAHVTEVDLRGWLVDWGHWLNLWQRGDINAPTGAAVAALLHWKESLPAQSFAEMHELLDQLLLEGNSKSEKLAVLQILKTWQRSMLQLNNSALEE